jgi:hypothetical protein
MACSEGPYQRHLQHARPTARQLRFPRNSGLRFGARRLPRPNETKSLAQPASASSRGCRSLPSESARSRVSSTPEALGGPRRASATPLAEHRSRVAEVRRSPPARPPGQFRLRRRGRAVALNQAVPGSCRPGTHPPTRLDPPPRHRRRYSARRADAVRDCAAHPAGSSAPTSAITSPASTSAASSPAP